MLNCAEFVGRIAKPFLGELRVAQKLVNDHSATCALHGHSLISSTSNEDCMMLYTLIRQFSRKQVFEIGTYIGATALAMNSAARKNGGVCTTCDPIDFSALPHWTGLRFIHAGGSIALRTLQEEGHKLDFIFFDWKPDAATLAVLPSICTENCIFAVHDFTPTDPKGREAVEMLQSVESSPGQWYVPDDKPVNVDGMTLNHATAFFIPSALV